MILVSMIGSHQPLAYAALRSLVEDRIQVGVPPQEADILLFGHPGDLIEAAPDLVSLCQAHPDKRVVYLSEEPFWDTIGPIPPFDRHRSLDTAAGPLPITCLTHHTSTIFDFDRIPYFLLTEHVFAARYATYFTASRTRTKADWRAHFACAPLRVAFMAENRLSPKLDVRFPEYGVRSLCVYRTELAIRYRTGPVLRAGRGWPAGAQDRVALPDWHLDKLQMLDQRCVFVSGLENTHQRAYVSEKIFDAFAVGAVPLYYAAPDHAVHRIAPPGSWLNLYSLTPETAVAAINAFEFDDAFLDRYVSVQEQLADLFTSPAAIAQERVRLRRALLDEFDAVLEEAQPRS